MPDFGEQKPVLCTVVKHSGKLSFVLAYQVCIMRMAVTSIRRAWKKL